MRIINISLLFLTVLILTSCKSNKFDVDISDIDIELSIKRFEQDLFAIPVDSLEEGIHFLEQKYRDFFPLFNHMIISVGSSKSPGYPDLLQSFVTDYTIYQVYDRTCEIYPDLHRLTEEFETAFSYYNYYFPENPVPEIVSYIGGFNHSVVTADSLIGIGLDKYLGTDEEFYSLLSPPVPNYRRRNMHRDMILPDCTRAWGMTEFEFVNPVNNLLNNMIYEGKIMYFVRSMMPFEPDSMIWGFKEKQLEFCRNNEEQMWTYLVENKLLFNTEKLVISKFIEEGPFTKDFSAESPARAAVWVGYQIVDAYSEKNNITLPELMNETDYQMILNSSGYNP